MEKLLLTRTDSLIGANAAVGLANRFEVVGVGCESESLGIAAVDGASPAEIVADVRPRLVVHAGPIAASAWDAGGVGACKLLNRASLRRDADEAEPLAEACRAAGAKLIVVSTDAVFDGPRMFHGEQAPHCPRSAYGRAAAEVEARWSAAGALVLRSHVYGWSPTSYGANYAERMFQELIGEQPCPVDAVRHATPILASDFVEFLYEAYRADLRGTYHVAGAERTSPYRFAAELAAALGVPGRYVNLTSKSAASRRPYIDETSLHTLAFRRAVEKPLPMLREGLARFAAQAFNGYRARIADKGASRTEVRLPEAQAA